MHEISLPASVTESILAQRGRLHRYDRLAGGQTALLVIDLQNAFMLAGMPIEVPVAREIVPNVNRLAASVRRAAGIVVWVQMTLAGETERWSAFFDGDPRGAALEALTPGNPGHALHADLDVQPGDRVVAKTRYSAFIQGSSDLDAQLRDAGVDTVVVAGTLTNVCCESTARDAMMLNYKLVFVSDANAAMSDAEHNASLATIFQVFGDVRSTDDVIALLDAGAPPGR